MKPGQTSSSDIAFTPTVKAIQDRKGSRSTYAGMEQRGGWRTVIDPELAAFVEHTRSFFLATANSEGQPYVQHRGGPPGFLRVLDRHTLGFADFKGNRQFITEGNLEDNPKAFIFLIDYALQRRIKIWGTAKMVGATPELLSRLMPEGYRARPEQIALFKVEAWDVNCPQHIPQRFEADDVARVLAQRDARIAELEALLAARDET
ncbi:pyridoxamine 5'-phosphate oxidase family protein [Hoeflea alexandrii]|uniref:pyridoxamine 5'-phosphate oxidase family protein n=1 Tax=Hoeflea alexandrii TaxID=288436 RepID=UPI0022AF8E57|nr:pyridoxamine 5'-phosphate oxidase family protein [Hoeflea alexandrii]MCZ4290048.1 pyridoxamine 5'-phosphate oxidase family protein [Hoeflea alexandrii]